MISALFKRFRPARPAVAEEDPTAVIDQLMAGPIKQRPKITIFGDDDVVGINPAPIPPSNEA
ncbi:MAG: hypothetical protein ACXWKO_02845 [Phenylobacterium sp.]